MEHSVILLFHKSTKENVMRFNLSVGQSPCPIIQGNQPVDQLRYDESKKAPSRFGWVVLMLMTLLLLLPAAAISKGGGGGNGGGGGGGDNSPPVLVDYGDVFGDLIHILRDDLTGQPIFAQRWVEMPEALPGYGWGYCQIGVDVNGEEIPFAPYSCELAPVLPEDVIEVDYFGRLNASRVQERNQRMHFNETITNIKQAVRLRLDPTGRLKLGFVDPEAEEGDSVCELDANESLCVWTTVDSPMENMALYQRMMKYGHLATDPEEIDLWWHGDPALPTPFHPALDAGDFTKLEYAGLESMLPDNDFCFGATFNKTCADPEKLTYEDFNTSAELLGAAAGKHNFITVDLVQYLNRFLLLTHSTVFADATVDTLPALYRDCWPETNDDPWKEGEEPPLDVDLSVDLAYGDCYVVTVDPSIPNYDDFSNVQELFVDFGQSAYVRSGADGVWNERTATVALEAIIPSATNLDSALPTIQADSGDSGIESDPCAISDIWLTVDDEPLLGWRVIPNPDTPAEMDIHNFVDAASDALRAIEYYHNYEVPENLYCTYRPDIYCPPPPPPTDPLD
jgi:hypothetical protein